MTLVFTRFSIVVATMLLCMGWGLSAVGQLNKWGYAISLSVALFAGWPWLRAAWKERSGFSWARWYQRLRQPVALAFFILAAMTFLGGLLYAPNNYDALAYRLPRTLHWLAQGRWHWIHTAFPRLNTRAQGCEWLMAPVLLFLRSERLLWLQSFTMFLALPGLTFTFLRGCGVARRVAWYWMWITPCGYSLLLQAGGISNDLTGAFFALAAVALAIHARHSGRISDLWLSALAAALTSGMKASNAPFVLPWVVAAWPSLRLLAKRPLTTALLVPIAVLVSFIPGAILNVKFCGDWSGSKLELGDMPKPGAPVMISANLLGLAVQNLTPPVFPLANAWNARVLSALPEGYRKQVQSGFEGAGGILFVSDMQVEEGAGIGLGVTLLLLISIGSALTFRKTSRQASRWLPTMVRWAPWAAFLVFLAKMNLVAVARVATPYYLLLPGAILANACQEPLTRRKWWQGLVLLQFLGSAFLVVISPARPLWPALTVLHMAKERKPSSGSVDLMLTVYSVYRRRHDAMAPVREALPEGVKVFGLVTGDDVEASLWRPFGSRRFVHVIRGDTRAALDAEGVSWLIINNDALPYSVGQPLEPWLQSLDAKLERSIPVLARAGRGPVEWHLARLNPHGTDSHP